MILKLLVQGFFSEFFFTLSKLLPTLSIIEVCRTADSSCHSLVCCKLLGCVHFKIFIYKLSYELELKSSFFQILN